MVKYLWKSMRKGLNSHYRKKKWKLGKWYKTKGKLSMCENGFHSSQRIIDSMQYVPLENLAKVEVRGSHLKQSDKQCWEEMRIIKAWNWEKKDSVALAIYSTGLVLENFEKKRPNDKRPRETIEAAKKWLKNPTKENESAAGLAAWSAAWLARSAAWSAAESAAGSAAWSAAWLARSAESAAGLAARSAVGSATNEKTLDKIEKWILRRINKLEIIGEIK